MAAYKPKGVVATPEMYQIFKVATNKVCMDIDIADALDRTSDFNKIALNATKYGGTSIRFNLGAKEALALAWDCKSGYLISACQSAAQAAQAVADPVRKYSLQWGAYYQGGQNPGGGKPCISKSMGAKAGNRTPVVLVFETGPGQATKTGGIQAAGPRTANITIPMTRDLLVQMGCMLESCINAMLAKEIMLYEPAPREARLQGWKNAGAAQQYDTQQQQGGSYGYRS
jgi:hypothetical protein